MVIIGNYILIDPKGQVPRESLPIIGMLFSWGKYWQTFYIMEQTTNPVQSNEGKNNEKQNEDQMERKTRLSRRRGKMKAKAKTQVEKKQMCI